MERCCCGLKERVHLAIDVSSRSGVGIYMYSGLGMRMGMGDLDLGFSNSNGSIIGVFWLLCFVLICIYEKLMARFRYHIALCLREKIQSTDIYSLV